MKNILYLLFILLCFSCKKASTTTNNNNNNNNTEPTVTGKYYVKYKLDSTWHIAQDNNDQHGEDVDWGVRWSSAGDDILLDFADLERSGGLETKAAILALQGKTFTFNSYASTDIAGITSHTIGFESYSIGPGNLGTLQVTTVTDLNREDSNTGESLLEMSGTFTNAMVQMDPPAGGLKTITHGTFKVLVETDIY